MRPKHIFLILFLVSLGVVAVLFVRAMPHQSVAAAPAAPLPPKEEILVAARPLAAGLLLRAQDVTWRERTDAAQSGDIARPSAATRESKPESDETAYPAIYGEAQRLGRASADSPVDHRQAGRPRVPADRGTRR